MGKRKLALGVMVALVTALVTVVAAQSRSSAGTISIGWVGDKTGPTVGSQGPQLHAFESYIKMTNATGGVAGRQINLIEKDDQYNPTNELGLVKSLINDDHVPLIAGLGTSSGWAGVIPVFNQTGTVAYSGSANLKDLTYPFQPNIFEGNCNLSDQADVAIGYELLRLHRKDLKGLTVGVAAIQAASGQEWQQLIDARVQALGGTAVNETIPSVVISADVQVTDMQTKKVDMIFLHHSVNGTIPFLRSVAKFGLNVPVISSYGPLQEAVFTTAPYEASKNFLGVNCFTPPYLATTAVGKLATSTGLKYGYPTAEVNQLNWSLGWIMGQVIVQGLKNAHGDYSAAGIRKGLQAITNLDTGLSGPIGFGAKCHLGAPYVRPYTYSWKYSRLEPVGTYQQWQKYVTHAYAAPGTCGIKRGSK